MHIWVVGAGALGLLFAAKLAPLANVTLVLKSREQAELIAAEGIAVRDSAQETTVHSASVIFGEIPDRTPSPDWLLLTVKQPSLDERTIRQLAKISAGAKGILCFQNGIGHIERLAAFINTNLLYIAVTTEGARKIDRRSSAHTGMGITRIGKAFPAEVSESRDEKLLINLLNDAGFTALLSKHTLNAQWNKLIINAVINPLTAILRVNNGMLLTSPHWVQLMRTVFAECASVAAAEGIQLAEDLWEQLLEVCRRTADNHSSMLQDVLAGRITEIDWINGHLLLLAKRHDLRLPANEALVRLVKAMGQG